MRQLVYIKMAHLGIILHYLIMSSGLYAVYMPLCVIWDVFVPLAWLVYNVIKDFSSLYIGNVMFIDIVKLNYRKPNLVL